MQSASYTPLKDGVSWRHLRFFLIVPIISLVIFLLATTTLFVTYQRQHQDRIYTGVTVMAVDLSRMTRGEAAQALTDAFPYPNETAILLKDPQTGQSWQKTPAELGFSLDTDRTISEALKIGRDGNPINRLRDVIFSWYYGRVQSPVFLLDEGNQESALAELAAQIDQPAIDAQLAYEGETAVYIPAENGRQLNIENTRTRLQKPLTDFRSAEIELLVEETTPTIYDDPQSLRGIQQLTAEEPISLYLTQPLDDTDLTAITIPPDEWERWLRVETVERLDGSRQHNTFLDENAARQWLTQYATQLYREPVNARYYFDDATQELVLVSPHVNGRKLDIEATLTQLNAQVQSTNRSVPFIFEEIVPTVNSQATTTELGITELISERTTWFYGSSDARKRNIARAASNFYGIVIAPGEEFSFNKYLGTISEDDGYEEGLIIYGGQTIKGIGGGVCQVSTTVFQAVFYAGFPMTERWAHGYMLGYYNDGEGPGMDATVYSPIVDFKFINNTPYHLLIENYYNQEEESLTFKFYSTSMGRRIEKSVPLFENIVPAPGRESDVWQYDEDMEPGTVRQIDWATEGADVTVARTVYNADDEAILQETFVSRYIPWANGYMYGPEVNAPDYSLVPPTR